MQLSIDERHHRFSVQAHWTHELRKYILDRLNLTTNERVLEIGSGTGAILSELCQSTLARTFGLDINYSYLHFSRNNLPATHLVQGNGYRLPFREASFFATYCHYLLLWITDPAIILAEMRRVTKPGGWVIALAEPDYGGRIDYPQELETLAQWQADALRLEGANIHTGRQLSALFHQSGLANIEVGILGASWSTPPTSETWESEWQILTHDLTWLNLPPSDLNLINPLREIDRQAWTNGQRILFVPTFYAWGRVATNTRIV